MDERRTVASTIIAAGDAYASALEGLDRSEMTQALRDEIDRIARRVNAACDRSVYGFEAAA